MFETLKDAKKLGATVASAGALALGVGATTAEAAPAAGQEAVATATNPEHQQSLEELTKQSTQRLLEGKPINYYRGVVEIVDTNTHQQKANIENPIIIYRNGASAENSDFAASHPRSKYWAVGYIQKNTEGNLGNGNLVLLPFNGAGNNMVFHKQESKVPLKGDTIDLVEYMQLKGGGLDLDHPLDMQSLPLHDGPEAPLQVGELIGPGGKGYDPSALGGKGGDPNAPGIEGKTSDPSANG
jgi:hypothetical protein